MAIEKFRGAYFPLSNMYPLVVPIRADCDIWVPTSEHAYMANRFKDKRIQRKIAQATGDPEDPRPYKDALAAKARAYRYIEDGERLVTVTDMQRIDLMKRVVYQKIDRNICIRALLLSTGRLEDAVIYEGNNWGDSFWGVSPVGSRNGENNLGKILMELRENFGVQ